MAADMRTFSTSIRAHVHRGCMFRAFRLGHGWGAMISHGPQSPRGQSAQPIRKLKFNGFLRTHARRRAEGDVELLPAAIEKRQTPCPVIVVRGSRLGDEPFRRFTKVNADGTPIGRDRADGMSLLAQAIAGEATLDEISAVIDGEEDPALLLD